MDRPFNGLFDLSLALPLLLMIVTSSCAQSDLNGKQSASDGVEIQFEFLGKAGSTTVESIDLKSVPKGSKLPTGYSPVPNKTYNIKNDAIEYGETIVSFKVPTNNKEDFEKTRILMLRANELNPSGFEWYDCTIKGSDFLQHDNEVPDSRKERIAKFYPDLANRRLSCGVGDGLGSNNYFALGLKTGQPPKEPVTQIVGKLENVTKVAQSGEIIYTISLRNAGRKTASEVNFYSHFDDDSILVKAAPAQGTCQKAQLGNSAGSVVCHLGSLVPGSSVSVEFTARRSNNGGFPAGPQPNSNWVIEGFVKESPDDITHPINGFSFSPLAN